MNRRRLWLALAASVIVHLLAIIAPLVDLEPRPDLMRLEARLVRAAAAESPTQTPPPPARPKRKPEPKPVPEKPAAKIVDADGAKAEQAPEPAPLDPPAPPTPDPSPDVEAATAPEGDDVAETRTEQGEAVISEASTDAAQATGTGHHWPRAGQITFAVFMGEQRFRMGQSVHRWQMDPDGTYRLVAITEPTGVAAIPWFNPDKILWESRGRLTDRGFQPDAFVEKRELKGTTGEVELNWTSRELRFGGQNLPLIDGTQDVLSVFYQLGYPESADITELPVTTGRKLDIYKFQNVGEESLAMPFGMTWRTRHMRATWGTREVMEVWVAQDHFGLPVQVRSVDRKGVVYYLVATEVLVAKDAMDQKNP